jgi:hypothetical protein
MRENDTWIPSLPSQNGSHQEIKQQSMFVRMQGKRNSYASLLVMYFSAVTMEIIMEHPQKTKNRATI